MPLDQVSSSMQVSTSMIGGKPAGGGNSCLQVGAGCQLPAVGDYWVKMTRASGGGDYVFSFPMSTKRISLSAFRVSPAGALTGTALASGLSPLIQLGQQQEDFDVSTTMDLTRTAGPVAFPPDFKTQDLKATFVGSVGPGGRTFIGIDPTTLLGSPSSLLQAWSFPAHGAFSYFLLSVAQNQAGERSLSWVQGLPAVPTSFYTALPSSPQQLSPSHNPIGVGVTPTLSWSAPPDELGNGSVDFYEVLCETPDGGHLWKAWVPGGIHSITLPPVPGGIPAIFGPFTTATPVTWRVRAIRAGGLSYNQFNFEQLADRLVGESSVESVFIP